MSKPVNKDLNDLLNNRQPADDFEKEALEGFDLLGPEEALQAKAELDKAIYPTVFAEAKTRRPAAYWYAAAGLLLLVGVSAYFFLATGKHTADGMAQQLTPPQKAAAPETIQPEAPVSDATPAAATPASPHTSAATDLTSHKTVKAKTALPAINTQTNTPEKTLALMSDDANEAVAEAPVGYAGQPATAVVANSVTEDEVKRLPQKANAPEAGAGLEEQDRKGAVVVAKESAKRLKRSEAKRQEALPAKPVAVANSAAAGSNATVCYYSGGEEAFKKDLAGLLDKRVVNTPFSGTLVINFNRKVVSIVPNEKQLTPKEQKLVETALKKLVNFILPLSADTNALFYYRYTYKP